MSEMDTVDLVNTYRSKLPDRVNKTLHKNGELTVRLSKMVRNGWTIDQIVAETTRDLGGLDNPAAVVMYRLQQNEDAPPPRPTAGPFVVVPFCSEDCRRRAGQIEDDNGYPIGWCPCRSR